jgi:hypothetical protein
MKSTKRKAARMKWAIEMNSKSFNYFRGYSRSSEESDDDIVTMEQLLELTVINHHMDMLLERPDKVRISL